MGSASMIERASWQARKNNSEYKASLIQPELNRLNCKSVLDIGCNAGEVARRVAENRFVVGIDSKLDTRGFENPNKGVALGNIRLDQVLVNCLPQFDAILLLSVHHQWYATLGRGRAEELILSLLNVARRTMFFEFTALNSKYGQDMGFIDNDQSSLIEFGFDFLQQFSPVSKVKCLGACPEFTKVEPYRFMFLAEVHS